MKPRIPAEMIERLEAITRRLEALTDASEEWCAIEPAVKDAVRPYISSWVAPDVEALLKWARGEMTSAEAERHFPKGQKPPARSRCGPTNT